MRPVEKAIFGEEKAKNLDYVPQMSKVCSTQLKNPIKNYESL
ncbi:MAG TPA: hypothetical protein VN836_02115 [Verrucomicrobiae bacterium]|nr:hypothetical protein [Verrucomicrobiae bacterium]